MCEQKVDKLNCIKIKTGLGKTLWGEWKDKPQTGRKTFKAHYLLKNSYILTYTVRATVESNMEVPQKN